MQTIKLMEVDAGEMICAVFKRACAEALKQDLPVGFEFNSVFMVARPGVDHEVLLDAWFTKRRRMGL